MPANKMLWRWLRLMPNMAAAVLLVHQIVDIAEAGTADMSQFFLQHPWYMFTAVVSITMTTVHVVLAITKTRPCCSWTVVPLKHQKLELFFYSVDGAWGFLWVLQVVVQWLLPADHRAFTLGRTVTILLLYGTQSAIDVGCVYYLYGEWCHSLSNFAVFYKTAATTDQLELACLKQKTVHT